MDAVFSVQTPLDHGGSQIVNCLIRPDTSDECNKQTLWVGRTCYNGTYYCPSQKGGNVVGFSLDSGFLQELPNAGKFRISFASDNGDVPEVLADLFTDIRHCTDMPEPDRKRSWLYRLFSDIKAAGEEKEIRKEAKASVEYKQPRAPRSSRVDRIMRNVNLQSSTIDFLHRYVSPQDWKEATGDLLQMHHQFTADTMRSLAEGIEESNK